MREKQCIGDVRETEVERSMVALEARPRASATVPALPVLEQPASCGLPLKDTQVPGLEPDSPQGQETEWDGTQATQPLLGFGACLPAGKTEGLCLREGLGLGHSDLPLRQGQSHPPVRLIS